MTTHQRSDADRERFAALLIAGTPIATAAEQIGISRSTAQRWRRDDDVLTAIAEYRAEVRSEVSVRLSALTTEALDRVKQLLRSPETPPAVTVRICALLLAESRAHFEMFEISERLERLERRHETR